MLKSLLHVGLFLLLITPYSLGAEPITVQIQAPIDGSRAPYKLCVSGKVSKKAEIFLIAKPLGGDAYVQPAVTLRADLTFHALVYIGEDKPGLFEGQTYELRAVANPTRALKEGDILPSFPEAEAVSPVVEVVRSDSASSGCLAGIADAVPLPNVSGEATPSAPTVETKNSNSEVSAKLDISLPRKDTTGLALRLALGFAALLFLIAMTCPPRAHAIIDLFNARSLPLLSAVVRLCKYWQASVWGAFARQWHVSKRHSHEIWSNKGHSTNFRQFVRNLLLAPLFWGLFFLTFFPSVATNKLALELVMPPDGYTSSQLTGGGFLAEAATPPTNSDVPVGQTNANGHHSWFGALRENFTSTLSSWKHDMLTGSAIGITAIDAALGAVLLFGIGARDAVRITFRRLLQERPIPCLLFVAFNLGMTLLSAFRANEMTAPETNPVVPVAVAAVFALVIPWIMAWTFDCALETTVRCAGTAGSGTAVAAIAVSETTLPSGWALLLGAFVVLVAATALLAVLALYFGIVFAWLADSTGDMIRVAHAAYANSRTTRTTHFASWAGASTGSVGLILLLLFILTFTNACHAKAAPMPAHKSSEPYRAWVFVVDTSQSPLPEEFSRLQLVLGQSIQYDMLGNDLAWLIPIKSSFNTAKPYQLPWVGKTHHDPGATTTDLNAAKAALDQAIQNLKQQSVRTDLVNPISLGLNILKDESSATEKYLVIGSDFLVDNGDVRRDDVFVKLNDAARAQGVHVVLIFTSPKPDYLKRFHLSESALYASLDRWAQYFQSRGAAAIAVRNVDALAAHVNLQRPFPK